MEKNILVTCPPMLKRLSEYQILAKEHGINLHSVETVQTLTVQELINLVPRYDGWIVGDDPVTYEVLEAGKKGLLKGVVKWGVGTDNIDFQSSYILNVPVENIPAVFNKEVADVAISYLIGLARNLFFINDQVRKGVWSKMTGVSLENKKVCLIGYGNIGKEIFKRLELLSMVIKVYDPFIFPSTTLDECLLNTDFIIVACSLTKDNYHLLNYDNLKSANENLRIVNVSRGQIIDENAVIKLQEENKIHSVAFDVFETEPLPVNSKLLDNPFNVFGSHNASNTIEAVDRTSVIAIKKITNMIK